MAEKQRTPEWLVGDYPPLKYDLVGKAAVEGQLVEYPQVVRTMVDPPVNGQRLSLLSFMLFSEPRKLSNGVPVYGYVKCRGNWADENQAKFEASKIIREYDSKYQIRIAPTGVWMPITDESAFVKDQLDVTVREGEKALRDQAMKEKEAKERAIMREIREREEELRNDGDIYDDPESLRYYSMKRVTELRLQEKRDELLRTVEGIKASILKVQRESKTIELTHPEYVDQWVDCYNEERRKSHVPDYVPSEEYENEHAQIKFDDLEVSSGETSSEHSEDEPSPAASSS